MAHSTQHEHVLDIGAEQLGRPYALAMLGAAAKQGVSDQVLQQLTSIVDDGLRANPALAAVLASPRVSQAEKDRVIDRLFGGQAHPILIRTMKVMNSHGRLGYLRAVRDAAVVSHDEVLGRVVAEVRTAVPLDDSLRGDIVSRISRSLGKEVRLQEVVDPELIGGMVVRVGDTVFDSSVAGRLAKVGQAVRRGFAKELMQRSASFVDAADTAV